jgi:hypothetical protein
LSNYTRDPPKELDLPTRLVLLGIQNQRAESPNDDSRLINGYVEKTEDGVIRVVKRPGLSVYQTVAVDGSLGLGMFEGLSVFRIINGASWDDKLYLGTALLGILQTKSGPLIGADIRYSFCLEANGVTATSYLINGRFAAWTVSEYVIKPLRFAGYNLGILVCGVTVGLPTVTTADTSTLTEYTTVTGVDVPANTLILSIDSATQFTMTANATGTNAAENLTFASAGGPLGAEIPHPGVGPFVPTESLAHGVIGLNKSSYLMSMTAGISGSDTDEPRSWNPLNRIYAYAQTDLAVALSTNLNYAIALKAETTEFFRDAGNSPGSPLERVEGLKLDVGIQAPYTVQEVDGQVFWVSHTDTGVISVWRMFQARAGEIAIPAVKRVLALGDPDLALSFSISGHTFYLITCRAAGVTLVYDITAQFWSYWSALGETYFPFAAAQPASDGVLLQHESNGKIYKLDPTLATDDGAYFNMDIYPPEFDGGTRNGKYLSKLYVTADQEPGSILKLRVSDDNQLGNSWTNFRELDLSTRRPWLDNCGTFVKRQFHFRHSSPTPCRLSAVELVILPGVI